mgnify:CR=1 FL=1
MSDDNEERYDLGEYDHAFFIDNQDEQFRFGGFIIPKLNDLLKPKTVVDIGCAGGGQIELWRNLEVDARGVEGSPNIDEIVSTVAKEFILSHDLRDKLESPIIDNVDLIQSYEVAEHIEHKFSEVFVENMTIHNPKKVIITAAPVGQAGTHHVNCQNKDYWVERFEKNGYNIDNETEEIVRSWGNPPNCAPWFLPNLMVYKRG